jgi:hypothetical protein
MKPVRFFKVVVAILLVGATHIAMGSFTGFSAKKSSNMYSLKNFNRNFTKLLLRFQ